LVEKRERMALILGDKGTGKTTLAKKFTKYTMD